MYKHTLFFNGQYITVWGPMSRAKCYQCFINMVAQTIQKNVSDIMWALQLSDIEETVTDIRAYSAWEEVQNYILYIAPLTFKQDIILKCDEFLTSSPPSPSSSFQLLPPPPPNKVNSPLDQLTEIVCAKRESSLDGIILRLSQVTLSPKINLRSYLQRFIPAPQTIVFLLVITTVFGSLLAPFR